MFQKNRMQIQVQNGQTDNKSFNDPSTTTMVAWDCKPDRCQAKQVLLILSFMQHSAPSQSELIKVQTTWKRVLTSSKCLFPQQSRGFIKTSIRQDWLMSLKQYKSQLQWPEIPTGFSSLSLFSFSPTEVSISDTASMCNVWHPSDIQTVWVPAR